MDDISSQNSIQMILMHVGIEWQWVMADYGVYRPETIVKSDLVVGKSHI